MSCWCAIAQTSRSCSSHRTHPLLNHVRGFSSFQWPTHIMSCWVNSSKSTSAPGSTHGTTASWRSWGRVCAVNRTGLLHPICNGTSSHLSNGPKKPSPNAKRSKGWEKSQVCIISREMILLRSKLTITRKRQCGRIRSILGLTSTSTVHSWSEVSFQRSSLGMSQAWLTARTFY